MNKINLRIFDFKSNYLWLFFVISLLPYLTTKVSPQIALRTSLLTFLLMPLIYLIVMIINSKKISSNIFHLNFILISILIFCYLVYSLFFTDIGMGAILIYMVLVYDTVMLGVSLLIYLKNNKPKQLTFNDKKKRIRILIIFFVIFLIIVSVIVPLINFSVWQKNNTDLIKSNINDHHLIGAKTINVGPIIQSLAFIIFPLSLFLIILILGIILRNSKEFYPIILLSILFLCFLLMSVYNISDNNNDNIFSCIQSISKEKMKVLDIISFNEGLKNNNFELCNDIPSSNICKLNIARKIKNMSVCDSIGGKYFNILCIMVLDENVNYNTCIDTDDLNNSVNQIYLMGYVLKENQMAHDSCRKHILKELKCVDDKIVRSDIECGYGCLHGKCLTFEEMTEQRNN